MPSRRASATIFCSSPGSKRSPCLRRTGVSIADHRDARHDARALRLIEHVLHIVGRERRAAGRERHQRQVAERLRAVAFVLIEVALFLDDHAARPAGERAHRHVIGERAGRHEDRALLAEHARELRLPAPRRRRRANRSRAHRLLVEQAREQARVLRGREAEAVAAQPNAAIVGGGWTLRARGSRSRRAPVRSWPDRQAARTAGDSVSASFLLEVARIIQPMALRLG